MKIVEVPDLTGKVVVITGYKGLVYNLFFFLNLFYFILLKFVLNKVFINNCIIY